MDENTRAIVASILVAAGGLRPITGQIPEDKESALNSAIADFKRIYEALGALELDTGIQSTKLPTT